MGLSLKEHNAIAGLADVLYDFLPGSGSQLWTDTSPPAVTRESRCSNRLTFARLPYFFAWPLPRPLEGDEWVRRLRVCSRTNLDQVLDLKSGPSQQGDPITVGEMKLNAVVGGPFNAIYAECRTQQPVARCIVVFSRHTEGEQESINKEVQSAARS